MKGILVCFLVGVLFLGSIIGICAGFEAAFGDQAGKVMVGTLAIGFVTVFVGFIICSVFDETRVVKALNKWANK